MTNDGQTIRLEWKEAVRLAIARLQDEGELPHETIVTRWNVGKAGMELNYSVARELTERGQ